MPARIKPTVWMVDTHTASLADISSWCLQQHEVNRLLVAIRMRRVSRKWQPDFPGSDNRVKDLFEPHLLDTFLASAWPGTEMIGHPGQVFVMEFNETVRDLLLKTQPNLNEWHEKNGLPEDICFFKRETRIQFLQASLTRKTLGY